MESARRAAAEKATDFKLDARALEKLERQVC